MNLASTPSLSELVELSEFESFPLLWPLLLRIWIAGVGEGDAALRVFGFLGGSALFAAVWFASLRLGWGPPLLSLALLAVDPAILRWGTSVRAWGVGAAFAIVALVLVREAAKAPSRRRVLLACLFAVLSVQCVYQNAVLLAAAILGAGVVIAVERRWRRLALPFGIGLVAAVSLLPYAATMRRAASWRVLGQSPPDLELIVEQGGALLGASGSLWVLFIVGALLSSGRDLLSSAVARAHGREDVPVFSAVALVAAVAGLALFLWVVGNPTQPWYYLSLAGVVAVCGESLIAARFRSPSFRVAIASCALLITILGFSSEWPALRSRLTNVDLLATHLNGSVQPGDLILVNPWHLAISFDRYYDGRADVVTIPPLRDRRVHRYDLLRETMLSGDPIGPILSRVRHVLQSDASIWIVGALRAPAPGTAAPIHLPPPRPSTGWNVAPYEESWTLQLGALIRDHAESIVAFETPEGFEAAAGFEAVPLFRVRGWRRRDLRSSGALHLPP